MKKTTLFILSIIIISCGPSAQEKAAIQQKHDDSLKAVTETEVMQKIKFEEDSMAAIKMHEDSITTAQRLHDDTLLQMSNQYNILQKVLVEEDTRLTVLNDRKNRDAKFHLGRTQSQREQWLKNDERDIDNLKLQMMNIKNKMDELKTKTH